MEGAFLDILERWSVEHGMTFFITTINGHMLSESFWHSNSMAALVADRDDITSQLEQAIEYLGEASDPVIVEVGKKGTFHIVKAIMVPLQIKDRTPCFLWCGWFKDYGEKSIEDSLDPIPFLNSEQKSDLFGRMKHYQQACITYLSQPNNTNQTDSGVLSFIIEHMVQNGSMKPMFEGLNDRLEGLDFIGFASCAGDGVKIDQCTLPDLDANRLTFMPGEGYIGKVFATKKDEVWKVDPMDPRAMLFSKNNQPLKLMACFPVHSESARYGVLFFGSYSEEALPESHYKMGHQCASLLGFKLQLAELTNQEHIHAFQLSALMEMVRNFDQLNNKKAIATLLLDICMNVLQTLNCFIYYPSDHYDEEDILDSRGFTMDAFNLYLKDVLYRLKQYDRRQDRDSEMRETALNQQMFECLLWNEYRNKAGMIAFGFPTSKTNEFFYSYLQLIGKMINGALNRISHDTLIEDRAILLTESLSAINPERHQAFEEAKELAAIFFQYIHLNEQEKETCVYSIKLVDFPIELLNKADMDPEIIKIIEEYKQMILRKSLKTTNPLSKVLYLTMSYIEAEEKHLLIEGLKKDDFRDEWVGLFFKAVHDWEQLKEQSTGKSNPQTFSQKNALDCLTKRELEILDMLSHGLKNQDLSRILTISEFTVKNHVSNVYKKLGIKNRSQATSLYLNHTARYHASNEFH